MPVKSSESLESYATCYPEAVHKSSIKQGWSDLVVDLNHFDPFERDWMICKKHHISINFGFNAPLLKIASDDRPFEGEIHPGKILITPAGQPVKWSLMDKAQALSISLQPEFVRDIAAAMEMKPDRELILNKVAVSDRKILICGELLLEELETGDAGGCLIAESLARILAAHLLRYHTSHPPRNRNRRVFSNNDYVLKVKEILDDGMKTNYGRLDLAKLVHKSANQLDSQFKKRFGITVIEYQRRRRVELAREMLWDGHLSILDVSNKLGYCNISHFYREFKKYVRCTPAEFKKSPF